MTRRKAEKAGTPLKKSGVPDPTARECAAIEAAVAFCRSKPEPHRTKVDAVQANRTMSVLAPHSDTGGYLVTLNRTFGTGSTDFAQGCQGWLANITTRNGRKGPTETDLNSALAAVGGVEPRDEIEAMLAVQMVGTHETAMSMLSMAKHSKWVDQGNALGNLAVKLLRTYVAQTEALAKLRRKGEQTVRVEHVHVHPGGQAIVGPVSTGGSGGGGHPENGHQPYGPGDPRAVTSAPVAPLLREDAPGDGVSVARDAGEAALSAPRRRTGKRGSEG